MSDDPRVVDPGHAPTPFHRGRDEDMVPGGPPGDGPQRRLVHDVNRQGPAGETPDTDVRGRFRSTRGHADTK
jgi:hypothetical protein